ncbi:MAG: phosphotransferase family protein [Actinomycetes bacterium]
MNDLTEVRGEDSFDVEMLHVWLKHLVPELSSLPKVMQFRSGASNLTYLLQYPDRDLVLRRPPFGVKAASAHDMRREVLIQSQLQPYFPYVPSIIGFSDDPAIMNSDFYVMERVKGTILRRDLPAGTLLSADRASAIGASMIQGWVDLHSVDASILKVFNKGDGYVKRQVDGWSKRYRSALTDDVPDGEDVMKWLDGHQPSDVNHCIIHGDWRLDNLVLDIDEAKLVGVLDWELATVGDPLMDLGASLAYWINADDPIEFANLRRQPSNMPGMPTRDQIVERYVELSGIGCDDFTFYEIFGLFRLSVIIQQIWIRYRLGQTTNHAFADFGSAVTVLIDRARSLMK